MAEATLIDREVPKSQSKVPEVKRRALPVTAEAGEIYNPRYGTTHRFSSFDTALGLRLDGDRHATLKAEIARHYFRTVTEELSPKVITIMQEMKKLGVTKDLLFPADSFRGLARAIKADQLGESQPRDYPKIKNGKYTHDPRSPLYEVAVADGVVSFVPEESARVHLNTELETENLQRLLQDYYDTSLKLPGNFGLHSDPDLYRWVEGQALNRSVLAAKGELKPLPLTLEGATLVRRLEGGQDAKQMSNPVEIWQTADGRRLIVKGGEPHTLQAEILENRLMAKMGLPVPETYMEMHDGEAKLIVGLLSILCSNYQSSCYCCIQHILNCT